MFTKPNRSSCPEIAEGLSKDDMGFRLPAAHPTSVLRQPCRLGSHRQQQRPLHRIIDGGGHVIANLYVNRTGTADEVGLFGYVGIGGVVRNLGLTGVEVRGGRDVGALAGGNEGRISASYAAGTVISENAEVGGLVGANYWTGTLSRVWAAVNVRGDLNTQVGGLAGSNYGTISAAYALGSAYGRSNASVGGLVGYNNGKGSYKGIIEHAYSRVVLRNPGKGGLAGHNNEGTITGSYYDTSVQAAASIGGGGKSTQELTQPTGYAGIYVGWNADLDNADGDNDAATGGDDPWDFGTATQYPLLKVDFDGNGTAT